MWYYTVNNQPVGPVNEEKLKKLLASQSINANTLVWKEGMAEWKPLGQTELAKLTGGVPMPVPPMAPAMINPEAALVSDDARNLYDMTRWYKYFGFPYIGLVLLYKAWVVIPENSRRLQPWKVILQLFIPLFDFYWIFVAIKGLPKELNAHIAKNGIQTPPVDESLALWLCILGLGVFAGIIPVLGWVIAPLAGIGALVVGIIFMNKLKVALIAIYEHQAKK